MTRPSTESIALFLSVIVLARVPVHAAAGALTTLTSGQYVATLTPAPDQGTANGIVAAVQAVPGILSASASSGSSTLQLTVRSNSQVDVGTLNQAITNVNSAITVGTPQSASPPTQNPALGPVH
jgi:hypothetical protein